MGVNRAGFGIIDDEVVREAAKQEIIRRYFWYKVDYVKGKETNVSARVGLLMEDFNLKPRRPESGSCCEEVMKSAPKDGKDNMYGAAIELKTGEIATGKRSVLMDSASA